ncbi:hypothetical protein KIL84_009209 [Mauremys mutica]|uniref:Uncharacterized protein n=1 Tax=Mauremys mutica TaxID=74926 RepID=A0A9D4B3R8_9SAUR|nr:hypothetical protein KIL84_009209 [Mauremys mutica]
MYIPLQKQFKMPTSLWPPQHLQLEWTEIQTNWTVMGCSSKGRLEICTKWGRRIWFMVNFSSRDSLAVPCACQGHLEVRIWLIWAFEMNPTTQIRDSRIKDQTERATRQIPEVKPATYVLGPPLPRQQGVPDKVALRDCDLKCYSALLLPIHVLVQLLPRQMANMQHLQRLVGL